MLRVGIGHDTHRLAPGRTLRLGGVIVPHDAGLLGHSDADVLLHALIDALLGAAGLGDIGEWFPDTDPANLGRDSAEMLAVVLARLAADGWRVVNADCIVFAQQPRLGPYKETIRSRLAALLDLPPNCVNVKAKTGEHVGPIGRGEAMAAQAVVLLESPNPNC